jgi:tight adherence protein B
MAIDTSFSMRGGPLTGAIAAANTFIRQAPSDVRVGVVTFSSRARLLVSPTSDRRQLHRAISGLRASGRTALFDAVALALGAAGPSGVRTVILLTDGGDDASRNKLNVVAARAHRSGVTLDAVAFRTPGAANAPLQRLSSTTRGQVVAASHTRQLTTAFRSEARDIAREILVTAAVPPALAGQSATVSISAAAGGQTLTDQAFTTLPNAGAVASPGLFGPRPALLRHALGVWWSYAAAALLFLALLALLLAILVTDPGDRPTEKVRRRLSIYTLTGRAPPESEDDIPSALGTSAIARSAVELAGRVVRSGDFETGLARRLDAASVPFRPAEWLLLHLGVALVVGFALLVVSGGRLLAGILGVVIGVVVPLLVLNIREERRRSAFLAQLPDTLQLIAGSLSAGYSLPQAIDTVIREGHTAATGEFSRALLETRLGLPLEDALDGIAERTRSTDFGWVVMAIRIHREVGGNLAEVLTNVAETLRERDRLRRQVQVLSAEGRLSAYILGGLPPLFAVYLLLVRPQYLRVLYTSSIGIVLLLIAFALLAVGVTWLRRVVRVQV